MRRHVEVQGAGGLLIVGAGKESKVLLIHRPNHQDWSLPKGKLHTGESFEDAALREVKEETGLRCSIDDAEPFSQFYDDRMGRYKEVRYWRMTVIDGSFVENAEVDETRWVPFDEALDLITRSRDIELFERVVHSLSADQR